MRQLGSTVIPNHSKQVRETSSLKSQKIECTEQDMLSSPGIIPYHYTGPNTLMLMHALCLTSSKCAK